MKKNLSNFKNKMYMNKNKALSFVEIVISISIIFIISFMCLSYFSLMNASFIKISKLHKSQKELMNCRELISSYINWSESTEIRIKNVSGKNKIKSIEKVFSEPSDTEGNLLFLKISIYKIDGEILENYYRCFLFSNDKLITNYYNAEDIHKLPEILSGRIVLDDCSGKFILMGENIKIEVKDNNNGNQYEEILF